MVLPRNGSYPEPPYWPNKLSDTASMYIYKFLFDLVETEAVFSSYIMDGGPGPAALFYLNEEYVGWWPASTIERAQQYAERL